MIRALLALFRRERFTVCQTCGARFGRGKGVGPFRDTFCTYACWEHYDVSFQAFMDLLDSKKPPPDQ